MSRISLSLSVFVLLALFAAATAFPGGNTPPPAVPTEAENRSDELAESVDPNLVDANIRFAFDILQELMSEELILKETVKTDTDRRIGQNPQFSRRLGTFHRMASASERDPTGRRYDYATGPCACSRKPPLEGDRRSCRDMLLSQSRQGDR